MDFFPSWDKRLTVKAEINFKNQNGGNLSDFALFHHRYIMYTFIDIDVKLKTLNASTFICQISLINQTGISFVLPEFVILCLKAIPHDNIKFVKLFSLEIYICTHIHIYYYCIFLFKTFFWCRRHELVLCIKSNKDKKIHAHERVEKKIE